MNGVIGETAVVALGLNGLAGWALAAYAVKRGWRVNTGPEKKPTATQNAATPAPEPESQAASAAVPAGANGAAGG